MAMKRLYLLRHADAPAEASIQDKMRPLSAGGEDDCYALGVMMAAKNYIPDVIFCSTATRTQCTYGSLVKGIKKTLPKEDSEHLYNAAALDIFDLIRQSDDTHSAMMVIGHNPGIQEIAMRLCDLDQSPLSDRLMQGFSTATLAILDCPVQVWNDLQLGENILADYQAPIDYNAPDRPTRWM